jgi:peroxiredoxin
MGNKAPTKISDAPGPVVNEKAPLFRLSTASGTRFDLTQVLKGRDVMLVFYQGNKCSACLRHLKYFDRDFLRKTNSRGVTVAGITMDTVGGSALVAENSINKIYYTLLSDYGGRVTLAYDVAKPSQTHKKGFVPLSSIVLINKTGKVVFQRTETLGPVVRITKKQILQAIDSFL